MASRFFAYCYDDLLDDWVWMECNSTMTGCLRYDATKERITWQPRDLHAFDKANEIPSVFVSPACSQSSNWREGRDF